MKQLLLIVALGLAGIAHAEKNLPLTCQDPAATTSCAKESRVFTKPRADTMVFEKSVLKKFSAAQTLLVCSADIPNPSASTACADSAKVEAPRALVVAGPGEIAVNWTPPTKNTDDSPLTNLAGYRLLWRKKSDPPGAYPYTQTIANPSLVRVVVPELALVETCFSVVSYVTRTVDGAPVNIESELSNEACGTPEVPGPNPIVSIYVGAAPAPR